MLYMPSFNLKKKKKSASGRSSLQFHGGNAHPARLSELGGRGSSQPFPGSSELSRPPKPQKYGHHVRFMKLLERVVVSLQSWDSGDPALSR